MASIAAAVLAYAALVGFIGYPLVIWTAVLAAWSVLGLIVVLAADLQEKPAAPAMPVPKPAAEQA
jgi:hypothetical protein